MIAIYVAEGSPRELNVSARDRVVALRALAQTTHPSALDPLKKAVESTLRHQAHPNFIRWSVRNGNECRVVFALWLGTVVIAAGFIVAILLTLSNRPRGYRAFAAIAWLIGISTLFAATKGMCVVSSWCRLIMNPIHKLTMISFLRYFMAFIIVMFILGNYGATKMPSK